MGRIFSIRVQKLFVLILLLKIGTSFVGWRLHSPWALGFVAPLTAMAAYVFIGIHRRDTGVTDEKFADSCYYLGFIFTITSIIFSLVDLPDIGTRMQEMAVRFGAAMVSTVFGLAVRVTLVGFRMDFADAVQVSEEGVIDAARRFREQLNIASERFYDFQVQVDNAAGAAAEQADMRMERLIQTHADRLAAFFAELNVRNQETFIHAFDGIDSVTRRISGSVEEWSRSLQENLLRIESGVGAFVEGVTGRLEQTTFPDDYFIRHLQAPVAQLKESTGLVSANVRLASAAMAESTAALSGAAENLRAKTVLAEGAMDAVLDLTGRQQRVLETAQGQLAVLEQLGRTLAELGTAMTATRRDIEAGNAVTAKLTADTALLRRQIGSALDKIVHRLSGGTGPAGSLSPPTGSTN